MSSEKQFTIEALRDFQSWPLDRKVLASKEIIKEWYEKNEGKVYISFSGGKDSTVLLHLVRSMYPEVKAAFCDTGLEYPEIRKFVKTFDNVEFLKPKMNFKQIIKKYGYPMISKEVATTIYYYRKNPQGWAAQRFDDNSDYIKRYGTAYSRARWKPLRDTDIPISGQCCIIMKKLPAKHFERATGLKPYLGTMACESRLRIQAWLKNGCNSFDGQRPSSSPLSFWTEQDILKYIKDNNIRYCSVYGDIVIDENGEYKTTGCERTGCIFCGFGAHLEKEPNRFQKLKETHPDIWEYCMKPLDDGGLGMKDVLDFLKIKTE